MREYQKIETVFERDPKTKKLLLNQFRNPTVRYLRKNEWYMTEKIDGANIRVVWDGHKFSFYGRTDKSEVPKPLLEKLNSIFNYEMEQVFEQMFQDKEVILFGEGIGEKIQCGLYGKEYRFLVFDIMINGKYLHLIDSFDIAIKLGLETVPFKDDFWTLEDAVEAVTKYREKIKSCISMAGGNPGNVEGFVLRPAYTVYDSNFDRVIVKIKLRDFEEAR